MNKKRSLIILIFVSLTYTNCSHKKEIKHRTQSNKTQTSLALTTRRSSSSFFKKKNKPNSSVSGLNSFLRSQGVGKMLTNYVVPGLTIFSLIKGVFTARIPYATFYQRIPIDNPNKFFHCATRLNGEILCTGSQVDPRNPRDLEWVEYYWNDLIHNANVTKKVVLEGTNGRYVSPTSDGGALIVGSGINSTALIIKRDKNLEPEWTHEFYVNDTIFGFSLASANVALELTHPLNAGTYLAAAEASLGSVLYLGNLTTGKPVGDCSIRFPFELVRDLTEAPNGNVHVINGKFFLENRDVEAVVHEMDPWTCDIFTASSFGTNTSEEISVEADSHLFVGLYSRGFGQVDSEQEFGLVYELDSETSEVNHTLENAIRLASPYGGSVVLTDLQFDNETNNMAVLSQVRERSFGELLTLTFLNSSLSHDRTVSISSFDTDMQPYGLDRYHDKSGKGWYLYFGDDDVPGVFKFPDDGEDLIPCGYYVKDYPMNVTNVLNHPDLKFSPDSNFTYEDIDLPFYTIWNMTEWEETVVPEVYCEGLPVDFCTGQIPLNTRLPSKAPTMPSTSPTNSPSNSPSQHPSMTPTVTSNSPTNSPTSTPTEPSTSPSNSPSNSPSKNPSMTPTEVSNSPTNSPTYNPTEITNSPSNSPSKFPTSSPSEFTNPPTPENPLPFNALTETTAAAFNNQGQGVNTTIGILLAASGFVMTIGCVCGGLYCRHKYKLHKKKNPNSSLIKFFNKSNNVENLIEHSKHNKFQTRERIGNNKHIKINVPNHPSIELQPIKSQDKNEDFSNVKVNIKQISNEEVPLMSPINLSIPQDPKNENKRLSGVTNQLSLVYTVNHLVLQKKLENNQQNDEVSNLINLQPLEETWQKHDHLLLNEKSIAPVQPTVGEILLEESISMEEQPEGQQNNEVLISNSNRNSIYNEESEEKEDILVEPEETPMGPENNLLDNEE